METLIINGYIRQVEKEIKPKIIPTSINQICFDFYYFKNIVIYASQQETACIIGSIDMQNISNCKSWKCNIYSLDNNTVKISSEDYLISTGSHYAENILPPKYFSQKLTKAFQDSNIKYSNRLHAIFTNSSVVTFCDSQLHNISNSTSEIHAFYWKLPSFPAVLVQLHDNNLIYSSKHGLYSIGGYDSASTQQSIYNLNFNINENIIIDKHWKWMQLKNLNHCRLAPGSCMIENDYIVVAGGFVEESCDYLHSVEIYDIHKNEWKELCDLNIARSDCSMYYDKFASSRIYIGGSDGMAKPVEYYDFGKDKWYNDLPVTTLKHAWNSIIWIENRYLLYIASVSDNNAEFIDLRENNKDKNWKIVYGNENNQCIQLDRIFATSFAENAQSHYKLLR